MVNDIPLELQFAVEDAVKADTRLRVRFVYGDKSKLKPTDEAKGRHYCVPLGFGWSKNVWGHTDPSKPARVLFYKTYKGASHHVGMISIDNIAVVETIPSHTPGNKALQLWKASWYQGG